jgi:hypothetical protein
VLFLLVTLFVPSVPAKRVNVPGGPADLSAAGQETTADGVASGTTGTGAATAGGAAGGPAGGTGGAGNSQAGAPGGQAASRLPARTTGCTDRKQQVPGDPFSPVCIIFAGDNGGATSRGVSGTSVTVSFRVINEPGFQQAFENAAHANIVDTPNDIKRTVLGLADYFNRHFQLYGRKVNVSFYNGKGSEVTEILGGGQENAEVDAQNVSENIKAFADISGNTEPYDDALSRRAVINIGAPYLSDGWMQQHAPYAWSELPAGSTVALASADWGAKRVMGKPAAFAGGDLKGRTRKVLALAPENSWYQESVQVAQKYLQGHGTKFDEIQTYRLDLSLLSNQADNIIAKAKTDGITTLFCACDPLLPIFLTQKARAQNYYPEWVVVGTALTDTDLAGQLYDQTEWSHAFGISFLGQPQPLRASFGYNAYKSVRPQDEPAFAVDLIYTQMYLLWLGIQMAGPQLTPQTFQQGLLAWPGGSGPYGTWKFRPGFYTPTIDGREIYWDPNKNSIQTSKAGAYVESQPGVRYGIAGWTPADQPPVFPNGTG